jgi:hypothetical protein
VPWSGHHVGADAELTQWFNLASAPTGIAVRFDRDDRKALPKGKKSINIAHKNAGFLDVFARTNIIHQIGVLVSVFPGIP